MPAIPEDYRSLLKKATSEWGLAADPVVLRKLDGGRSTAHVFSVQVKGVAEGAPTSGEYVLKLDSPRYWGTPAPVEWHRHQVASSRSPEFAAKHIPKLERYVEHDGRIALLYEIPGDALTSLVTPYDVDEMSALRICCSELSRQLLESLNSDCREDAGVTAASILEALLSYRLSPLNGAALHDFVESQCGGSNSTLVCGELLVNALWFCKNSALTQDRSLVRIDGLLHGDLHPGNVLLDRSRPRSKRFWLIDFALSNEGPIGYDHAYFELAVLLRHLRGLSSERLAGVLRSLDAERAGAGGSIPPDDHGLFNCLREIRSEMRQWQQIRYPRNLESLERQFLLTRVAVGLNWANKPQDTPQRRLAFEYACWAATRYLTKFDPILWRCIVLEAGERLRARIGPPPLQAPAVWPQLLEAVGRFDRSGRCYILVAGRIEHTPDVCSLGLLPWSAVIDLDPDSDSSGLHHSIAAVLGGLRSLQTFGQTTFDVDFDRGTAWLMANGWLSRGEAVNDDRDWNWTYPALIRALCEAIKAHSLSQNVHIIVIPEGTAQSRLGRTLQEVDSALRESAKLTLISPTDVAPELHKQFFTIDAARFAAGVRATYGVQATSSDTYIPGHEGPVAIAAADLRHIEEDLEILHSRILDTSTNSPRTQDEFWRGNPPTWSDLHANLDIPRDLRAAVEQALGNEPEKEKTQTVALYHSPGSGGTTLALRMAWDKRDLMPTAVLRRYSRLTADRLDRLFHLAQRTILLIAEESLLQQPDREDLFRELASRHARVIIFYIIRTFSIRRDGSLALMDPMEAAEAARFGKLFSAKAQDYKIIEELKAIASSEDPQWRAYRSPFFFGLITYDETYLRVHNYVATCLSGASYQVKKVMKFLALVTKYTQTGMSEHLAAAIGGFDTTPGKTIEDFLGDGPKRLIVRQGASLRLSHPVLAERVLWELMGGSDWKAGLIDLSLGLIREVRRTFGNDPTSTKSLLEDLFIRRYDLDDAVAARNFSQLMLDAGRFGTQEGQHEIFAELTENFPKHSHYWNHRARHLIYVMHRDYEDAVRYCDAAIKLEPNEMVHHHMRGQVLRFWANQLMTAALAMDPRPDIDGLLNAAIWQIEEAFASFRNAREKSPESRYPLITRVQLTNDVADKLIEGLASGPAGGGMKTIQDVLRNAGSAATWLTRNVPVAEECLETLRRLRADKEPSRYERGCEARMYQLQGDLDEMVNIWESLLAVSEEPEVIRRNLAVAYCVRRQKDFHQRDWDVVPVAELQLISNMMDQNLASDPSNARDIRTWFQAARRLPTFKPYAAINRLSAWSRDLDSAEAHYYLYVLRFLLWLSRPSRELESLILDHLKECKALATNRRDYSYEWLGIDPPWCPLVNHATLGRLETTGKTERRTFADTSKLARISGFTIPNFARQGGLVKLGGKLTAFFVPSEDLYSYKDSQKEINFLVGFSYEGIRAWDAKIGGVSKAATPAADTIIVAQPTPPAEPKSVTRGASYAAPAAKPGPAEFRQMAQQVLVRLVREAGTSRGISLSELGERLSGEFPREAKVPLSAGYPNLTAMISDNPAVDLHGHNVKLRAQ